MAKCRLEGKWRKVYKSKRGEYIRVKGKKKYLKSIKHGFCRIGK